MSEAVSLPKIKISKAKNLTEARFGAGVLADFLGFNFSLSSKSFIDPEKIKEIAGWIQGPQLVAEFGKDEDIDYIVSIGKELFFDYIQIESLTDGLISKLKENDFKIIHSTNQILNNEIDKKIDYYLIQEKYISNNLSFLLENKERIIINLDIQNNKIAILLELGFNQFNIEIPEEIIENSNAYELITELTDQILN